MNEYVVVSDMVHCCRVDLSQMCQVGSWVNFNRECKSERSEMSTEERMHSRSNCSRSINRELDRRLCMDVLCGMWFEWLEWLEWFEWMSWFDSIGELELDSVKLEWLNIDQITTWDKQRNSTIPTTDKKRLFCCMIMRKYTDFSNVDERLVGGSAHPAHIEQSRVE